MDGRTVSARIADYSSNELGVPDTEGYGIEVEVERFDLGRRVAMARTMAKYWLIKDDGSLRNSGAEFVSNFLPTEDVPTAIHYLYGKTRKHWEPSPRTGIHVHANMLGRTFEDVTRICAYYAMVEPLVFMWAGMEREENIFCVPWYRAPDEAATVARALERADTLGLRTSCKYSGLFAGPLRTFGSIEFRHAKTFDTPEELARWWDVVRTTSNAYKLPDPIELYAREGAASVARTLLGGLIDEFSNVEVEDLLHDTGAVETAMLFQPSAHVFSGWGAPCAFDVGPEQQATMTDFLLTPRFITLDDDEDIEREDDGEYDEFEEEPEPADAEGEI